MAASNPAPPNAPASLSERRWVLLFCVLAALRVFVFSAAFPFFVTVDEEDHFDLVMKYSKGEIPRSLNEFDSDSVRYIAFYRTWEYLLRPDQLPPEALPPVWKLPADKTQARLEPHVELWRSAKNHEALNPPLYYAVAGLWLRAGQGLGLNGGFLLYWLRFLNVLLAAALVWVGFLVAKELFPDWRWLQLSVPLLAAVLPQDTFYSIQSDVLSPLCFALAFLFLVRWIRAPAPSTGLSAGLGLALAATGLIKTSNLPLLAVAATAVLLRMWQLTRTDRTRPPWPSLAVLFACVLVPLGCWAAWCFHVCGDPTGSSPKIHALNWTRKPFGEWWSHPLFTPRGLWTFGSGLMVTFWRGEFSWAAKPLASKVVDAFYWLSSLVLVGVAAARLIRNSAGTREARAPLGLALWTFVVPVAFLAFLSITFDFDDCPYPSRAYPYFASGRLVSGALIPFLLLYTYGLDGFFSRFRIERMRWCVVLGIVLVASISEIAINRVAFFSQYNWYHLLLP